MGADRSSFLLTQEIQLLKNYIDLEKLRYGQELDLVCYFHRGPGK